MGCVVYTNAELNVHNVFWTMHGTCYSDHVQFNSILFDEKEISWNRTMECVNRWLYWFQGLRLIQIHLFDFCDV